MIVLPERKRVHWIVTSETLRLTSENKKGWTVRKRRSFKEPGARAEPGKVFALPHDSLVERTKDTVYSLSAPLSRCQPPRYVADDTEVSLSSLILSWLRSASWRQQRRH